MRRSNQFFSPRPPWLRTSRGTGIRSERFNSSPLFRIEVAAVAVRWGRREQDGRARGHHGSDVDAAGLDGGEGHRLRRRQGSGRDSTTTTIIELGSERLRRRGVADLWVGVVPGEMAGETAAPKDDVGVDRVVRVGDGGAEAAAAGQGQGLGFCHGNRSIESGL